MGVGRKKYKGEWLWPGDIPHPVAQARGHSPSSGSGVLSLVHKVCWAGALVSLENFLETWSLASFRAVGSEAVGEWGAACGEQPVPTVSGPPDAHLPLRTPDEREGGKDS